MYEQVSEFPSVTSIFAIKNFVVLRQSQYVAQADLNSRSSLPDSPVLGLQASDILTYIPNEHIEKTRRESQATKTTATALFWQNTGNGPSKIKRKAQLNLGSRSTDMEKVWKANSRS